MFDFRAPRASRWRESTAGCQGGHYWDDINPSCPVNEDPWVSEAPFYARWGTTAGVTTADPINTKPGIVATTPGPPNNFPGPVQGFTIGTDDTQCGVEGKAVIVHKGGDGSDSGTRVACGILTQP